MTAGSNHNHDLLTSRGAIELTTLELSAKFPGLSGDWPALSGGGCPVCGASGIIANMGADGSLSLHCITGCDEEAIVAAAGLARADMRGAGVPAVFQAKELPPPTAKVPSLEIYSAADLHGKEFERPPFIVEGFLPAGLAILAAPPKRGKSWLALWLSICVAGGTDFLGMRVNQGSALYLDLESRKYRISERIERLLNGKAPPMLNMAHEARRIGEGLEDQLGGWLDSAPDSRLIILDTYQRIKPAARRFGNAYEDDYHLLEGLQKFALSRGVAVLLVHHLRKDIGAANLDPFERISGSTALTGCADTIYLLDGVRGSPDATLSAAGRDFESMSLAVRFDSGRWTCLGSDAAAYRERKEYEQSSVATAVHILMSDKQRWEGTSTELLDALYEADSSFGDALTPAKYISMSASSTDASRRLYRSIIDVSNGSVRSLGTFSSTSPLQVSIFRL